MPFTASSSRDPANNFSPYEEYPVQRQRREASDASVEALDLADYSRTLHSREQDEYLAYPPHTPPLLSLTSIDTPQLPSFASRGGTRSSNTHSTQPHSHRPFSLPPPSRYNSHTSHHSHNLPEAHIRSQDSEIDISHFPIWSRNWYDIPGSIPRSSSPPDMYTPIPISRLNSKRSPFDPGQIYPDPDNLSSDTYGLVPSSYHGHDSTRNLLPWSSDPLDSAPIHSLLKQERMRMLEREFGLKVDKGPVELDDGQILDEHGKPLVGTVNANGYLITQGPKKRAALRILQIALALTAAIPSIFAALVIKTNEPPPPAGKPPAFVLYILSVITVLLLVYLFIIRPWCCTGKRTKGVKSPFSSGIMVLPVNGLADRKKGKNKKGNQQRAANGGDVQINLVVDPEAFGRREESSEEEEDDRGWNESIPGHYNHRKKKRARRPRRKSVFAGLAMEENWKRARSWAKRLTFVDVALLILWGAAFIFIMIGKRCPSGGFEGWCNAYNVSTAASCLLSITFGISTFFNVKDLNDSKMSPRTRT
ncbi:hypothetical protein H0H87_002401 [Tephrocybe sp. NHM501043]|nr:hypothetical protein H0H87_002401 [Tephrocybe sp. NHM501043]